MRYYLLLHSGEKMEITAHNHDEALRQGQQYAEKCGETVEVLQYIGYAGHGYSVMTEEVC